MSSIIKAHVLGIGQSIGIGEGALVAVPAEASLLTSPPKAIPPVSPKRREPMEVMRKARQQATAMLAAAQAEAASLKEQAQAVGYAEGLQSGREQGLREGTAEGVTVGWGKGVEQAQETFRTAQEVLAAAEDERSRALSDMEDQIVELALAVAEKIVQREIELDELYLSRLISHALQQVTSAGRVVARVKPVNSEQLRCAEEMAQELAGRLQVVVDDSLSAGDCVIETDNGILDGRLQNRLESVRQALEGAVQ